MLVSLTKPIELALNTALKQDPETLTRLNQFDQRKLILNITDLNQVVSIMIVDDGIQFTQPSQQPADLTISGHSMSLLSLARYPENLFSTEIAIHGDVQFAKQLRDLIQRMDFDWEAQLAKLTGDTLAYPLAHGIRQLTEWAISSHHAFLQTGAEYLREERRLLPDKSLINRYISDIDTLRADLDRLDARIHRLKAKTP